MPTSSYMPDVVVEIAFNAGWATPAASRTWTDVSAYVELDENITITVGRSDERSTADANQLTLTLDNRDGRFTSGLASGPYHPLLIGRPIRVRADPVDGSDGVRFLGFVDAWPTEWSEGTDAYAKATINASSRLARIGMQAGLKSVIEIAILADSPFAYYTLGEPAGSQQANDSSGVANTPLPLYRDATLPVVFGTATGPGTDGLTAATFAGGQSLVGYPPPPSTPGISMEAFFLAEAAHGSQIASVNQVALVMTATGAIRGGIATATVDSPLTYADGATHHAAVTWDGSTIRLYVDGPMVASVAAVDTVDPIDLLSIGGEPIAEVFIGTIAHTAFFNKKLTDAQVLAHATAGLAGYAGETTSARLIRYAALAGIGATEVSAETGQTTMQHVDTTDKQVVELMRICETTEGGVLFDARDGILTFHNRAHRYTSSAIYTLNMAEGEVEAGYAPRVDLTGLANDITAQDIGGVYIAHVFDTTSRDAYGNATASIETASESKDEPLNLANWNLYEFKTPKERAPQLEVDALAQVGKTPNCAAVMASTVGDKITVSNRPAQAATSSVDYFVEGWTEVYGPESLRFTFNVSPSAPFDQVLVIDDPVRGVIDTNVIGL